MRERNANGDNKEQTIILNGQCATKKLSTIEDHGRKMWKKGRQRKRGFEMLTNLKEERSYYQMKQYAHNGVN